MAIISLVGLEKFTSHFKKTKDFFSRYRHLFAKKKIITIGGTNGKGETCFFLESLLLKKGFTTAMWTSPHVLTFTERIRLNGENVAIEKLMGPFEMLKGEIHLSYYEFLFALFCEYLAKRDDLDIIILEVGLGGRLDAVNVFDADLTALTSISRDHTEILGHRMRDILREKFAISRRKAPMITAFESAYMREKAQQLSEDRGIFWIDLFREGILKRRDDFVTRNYLLACVLREMLLTGVFPHNFERGKDGTWPSRLKEVTIRGNRFILIGTHNLDGLRKLVSFLRKAYPDGAKEMDLLVAFSKRPIKEVGDCLRLLVHPPRFWAQSYVTVFEHPRALPEDDVRQALGSIRSVSFVRSWKYFLEFHDKSKTVMVLGSNYFISNILKNLR